MDMSRLSIVIFGATGFTGKHAVVEMVRLARKYPGLTWGVAGRNEKKLQTVLSEASEKTGEDLSSIPRIIADVTDEGSLGAMCSRARVLASCCGPYRLYGEPVVRAAIAAHTHYVDVCGEPQFIERMVLEYGRAAREAGVYVISACGLDSVPADLGVIYLQQNFGGTVNSVESYLSVRTPSSLYWELFRRGAIHYGTWESLVYGLTHYGELRSLRRQLYPEPLPTFAPRLDSRPVLHRRGGGWALPFLGADNAVVYRSQRRLWEAGGARPAHFRAYLSVDCLLQAVLMLVAAVFLYLMCRASFTRNLLLKYPRLFSLGLVSHEGPSAKLAASTMFHCTLYAAGWAGAARGAPDRRVTARVSGMNPGYQFTVTALLLAALTILREEAAMPATGGVLATGEAFKDTKLIDLLKDNFVKFQIVDTETIS